MNRCSWLTNSNQCENITDRLVCSTCEDEKSLLYHQYKEAEKTVISAINDALPRGDLLEASKVITRINRVVKLRRKFTSRLAPQSRDVGHEYRIKILLNKIQEYHDYISRYITNKPLEDTSVDTKQIVPEYRSYQQSITSAIQTVVESDPFAAYDSRIQEYQKRQREYEEYFADMEKLVGYTGDNLNLIITFMAIFKQSLDQLVHRIPYLAKGRYIEFIFNRHVFDIALLSHDKCIEYMSSVKDSGFLSYLSIIDWIVTTVQDIVKICCHIITVDGKNQLSVSFRVGSKYCPALFYVSLHIVDDEQYAIGLTPVVMTSDIEQQLKLKQPLLYQQRRHKIQ